MCSDSLPSVRMTHRVFAKQYHMYYPIVVRPDAINRVTKLLINVNHAVE